MFPSTSLLSLVAAAISLGTVSASPFARDVPSKFTLPFAAKINATGFPNIVIADQARAAAFKSKDFKRQSSISATNGVVRFQYFIPLT